MPVAWHETRDIDNHIYHPGFTNLGTSLNLCELAYRREFCFSPRSYSL
jgi:hypothetical protein